MVSNEALTKHEDYDPSSVERIAFRGAKPIEIVEHKPTWAADFAHIEGLIRGALPDSVLKDVSHVGSTSVAGLPAKDIIDVDVTVFDTQNEDSYVPQLEAAGFKFLLREPAWQQHRFFGLVEPYANIHVFPPDAAELVRHKMFRDWLREHEDDRVLYAQVKREAAEASRAAGEDVMQYNVRKQAVLRQILDRMFLAQGLLD